MRTNGGASGSVRGIESSGLAGLRAEVVAPLADGTRLLGLIAIGAPRRRRGQEKRLLSMASDLAAAALVNADRVRSSERWEQCDGLTGVLTRAHLLERLQEAMEHSLRLDAPLSVLLLDIDEFRHYNQSHGHEKGDEVLRQLGPLLRGAVREEDIVARWGGEEFAVVYRGADKQTALGLANGAARDGGGAPFPGRRVPARREAHRSRDRSRRSPRTRARPRTWCSARKRASRRRSRRAATASWRRGPTSWPERARRLAQRPREPCQPKRTTNDVWADSAPWLKRKRWPSAVTS